MFMTLLLFFPSQAPPYYLPIFPVSPTATQILIHSHKNQKNKKVSISKQKILPFTSLFHTLIVSLQNNRKVGNAIKK